MERIRGEKTALLPAMVSPSISITLFLPRSDSRYISANVLRTSCTATQCFYKEKKKAGNIFIINFVKYTRSGAEATFSGANGRYLAEDLFSNGENEDQMF